MSPESSRRRPPLLDKQSMDDKKWLTLLPERMQHKSEADSVRDSSPGHMCIVFGQAVALAYPRYIITYV